MKQTAVEWLYAELVNHIDMPSNHRKELFEQAKAMEKQRLEQFYNQGYTQCSIEDLKPTSRDRFVDAEDYYNKTFKSE